MAPDVRRRSDGVVLAPALAPRREPWPPDFTVPEVIRVLEPIVADARRQRLREVVAQRSQSVTVLMDAPHDPHNGAAVLRSADAFGLQQIHVVPRDEPFAFSSTVTRGSEKWVDVVVHATPAEAVLSLHERGFRLVATHPEGELEPEDLASIQRVALVLGNEHDGIRDELERSADARVSVRMRGFVESLNLSVSAAILIRAAMLGRHGDLSETDRERLYARGLFTSVARAREVLEASR